MLPSILYLLDWATGPSSAPATIAFITSIDHRGSAPSARQAKANRPSITDAFGVVPDNRKPRGLA